MVAPSTSNGSVRALDLGLQALAAEIVAIERDVDVADRVVAVDHLREALGDPGAARVDADEARVECDRAAHAIGERGERLLRRQAGPTGIVPPRGRSNQDCRISCAATLVARRLPRARAHAGRRERVLRADWTCIAHPRAPPASRSGLRAGARSARRARSSRAACRRACTGWPTTSRSGCHSPISAATAAKRAAFASAAMVVSGRATRSSVLPIATPIRRVPKSNASTVVSSLARCRPHASCVPDVVGQAREIDAEQAHRGRAAAPRRASRTGRRDRRRR